MNQYYYNQFYPQQNPSYKQYQNAFPNEQLIRQHDSRQTLEQRVNQLEQQNQQQVQELTRLNEEIVRLNGELNRVNDEIIRLNRNDELHTGRLNRVNQRLRTVERNLNIPYTAGDDGF
ncbi:hypothetical protein [Halalkalibacter krulwichiae]|uniref:Uncharacterized protein n=1 Tax=Halalkalibacter krulwichiae TaxID=199441 RepID=A0A1X9M828_9BACI|nr:hypothetical protein [Halalkalibacter krulwichiae]ARK29595.1 hypothetical protein BkAM31D_06810 [Halalkalibacter krulwichiae]